MEKGRISRISVYSNIGSFSIDSYDNRQKWLESVEAYRPLSKSSDGRSFRGDVQWQYAHCRKSSQALESLVVGVDFNKGQ